MVRLASRSCFRFFFQVADRFTWVAPLPITKATSSALLQLSSLLRSFRFAYIRAKRSAVVSCCFADGWEAGLASLGTSPGDTVAMPASDLAARSRKQVAMSSYVIARTSVRVRPDANAHSAANNQSWGCSSGAKSGITDRMPSATSGLGVVSVKHSASNGNRGQVGLGGIWGEKGNNGTPVSPVISRSTGSPSLKTGRSSSDTVTTSPLFQSAGCHKSPVLDVPPNGGVNVASLFLAPSNVSPNSPWTCPDGRLRAA